MPAEYMFGLHRGTLTKAEIEARRAIARRHSAEFNYVTEPGHGPRGWFVCLNTNNGSST